MNMQRSVPGGMIAGARWATMALAVAVSTLALPASPAHAGSGRYELVAQWGSYGSGDGQFSYPWALALDGDGNVYVADAGNSRIEKFDSNGNFLDKWGSVGSGNGEFIDPRGVAIDGDGNVYVTDAGNSRIEKFDSNGAYLAQWGSDGTGDGQFRYPWGIAVDGAGNVYVADGYANDRIEKFDANGAFLAKWGVAGTGDGQFRRPFGVGVDGDSNVYVADTDNHRIQRFDSDATFLSRWGTPGSADGQFLFPYAVTVDHDGNVYVADGENDRIEKFAANGEFLAKWGASGSGDGQFNAPTGVAVDGAGNVYVADYYNHRIEKFAPVATDSTPPAIEITAPSEGADYELGQSVQAEYSCSDEAGGSGLKSCTGDLANGAILDTSTVGDKSFTVTAEDNAGNPATETIHYRVVYAFAGFFSPVENVDASGQYVLNKVKAGSGVPVKFSLDGDQGPAIFVSDYPRSEAIACDPTAEVEAIEETVTAGSNSLSYDPTSDQYSYVWKTDKAWSGTCRQLVVKLQDGTSHRASFSFTR
jgi:sugar lactone lactonase YvrE